jgi:hypothetical protein
MQKGSIYMWGFKTERFKRRFVPGYGAPTSRLAKIWVGMAPTAGQNAYISLLKMPFLHSRVDYSRPIGPRRARPGLGPRSKTWAKHGGSSVFFPVDMFDFNEI